MRLSQESSPVVPYAMHLIPPLQQACKLPEANSNGAVNQFYQVQESSDSQKTASNMFTHPSEDRSQGYIWGTYNGIHPNGSRAKESCGKSSADQPNSCRPGSQQLLFSFWELPRELFIPLNVVNLQLMNVDCISTNKAHDTQVSLVQTMSQR